MNHRASTKKAQERAVLDHFIGHSRLLRGARIIPGESPDFVCRFGPHRSIGVELVQLPDTEVDKNPDAAVRKALHAKLTKLPQYRSGRHDEYWLLIWTDHIEPGWSGIRAGLPLPEDGYHRIFLFSLFQPSLRELNHDGDVTGHGDMP